MNAKRQTIWLVSMLSLMVVLSAYYLFTEDVSKLDLTAADSGQKPQEVKIDLSEIDKKAAGGEEAQSDAKAAASQTASKGDTNTKTDVKSDAKTEAKTTSANATKTTKPDQSSTTDEQVLQKMQAKTVSAGDYFTIEGMKQHEELRKKSDQLLTTIIDSKQTPEAVAKATNELDKISEIQEKIESLEETLLKDFPQALVTQEGNKWKVTVQSEKLEKSQGVTIVDLVINELGAAPENIKVQYVRP